MSTFNSTELPSVKCKYVVTIYNYLQPKNECIDIGHKGLRQDECGLAQTIQKALKMNNVSQKDFSRNMAVCDK